jgi:HlyD family secretion protein
MKRVWSKLFWATASIVAIGLLGYGFLPQPVPVDLASPVRGSLEITVDDDGETQIREKYVVSAPVSGKMLRIQLQAGDPVEEAETELARIKPRDPTLLDVRSRAEAEARVRAAEAAQQQATAAVTRAKETLKLAKQNLERAKGLRARDAISNSDFEAIESRERIAFAELRSAEFAAQVSTYEMDQARAALRYTLPDEQDDFDATVFRVLSPIRGVVLNVLHEDATVVDAGMPLMELGDPKDLEIKVDVLSTDAVQIDPGDPVYIENWGGTRPLAGVVRLVEPSAFLKVSALGVEEKRVNVIIDFVDPWEERKTLGDGFRIEARIVVEETDESALKVPAGTLFQQNDQWHVFRIVDGTARLTAVEIGSTNGLETEILAGLEESAKLVQHPPNSVVDGTPVVAIESM